MLFNSFEFLVFFPVVTILYFSIPHKVRWLLLLIASYYFYMCWKPEYAILLLGVTGINYLAGLAINKAENKKTKRITLITSVVLSLSALYYYKYFIFFGESINYIMSSMGLLIKIPLPKILLPVGISFFTFQALSYTIDVYKGKLKVEKNFGIFALFVSFFPQLVAGPIERATNLLPQFYRKHTFDTDKATQGLRLMLWGMFKKIVIADRAATYVDAVFNHYPHHNGISYMLATILFAFQIYCDFSGYSDLARGSARIMGFDLMVNFRFPYFSANVTKYWQKNHISLTTWLKDYLYFPLVEKNPTMFRICFFTFITFLLSGLWHGADWTFVIWGIWQAVFLIYDILMRKTRKKLDKRLKKMKLYTVSIYFRYMLTFIILCLGLIFFRASNFQQAWAILKGIATLKPGSVFIDPRSLSHSFVGIIILIAMEYNSNMDINEFWLSKPRILRWSSYLIVVASIMVLGVLDESQFIYFQF